MFQDAQHKNAKSLSGKHSISWCLLSSGVLAKLLMLAVLNLSKILVKKKKKQRNRGLCVRSSKAAMTSGEAIPYTIVTISRSITHTHTHTACLRRFPHLTGFDLVKT